jgi:type II secretory pathway pseudopilin PulG
MKARNPRERGSSCGMTLVEVMVAAVIMTMLATSLVALFIQNARFARAVALRTVATTTAVGVAEQIRSFVYADLAICHNNPTTSPLEIELFDPTNASAPQGMHKVEFPINSADGKEVNSNWTAVTLPMVLDETGKKTRLPVQMRFWVSTQLRQPTITKDKNGNEITVTRCQLFEVALIYQWKNPNFSDKKWNSGVIRIVTPNLDMNVLDVPVKA